MNSIHLRMININHKMKKCRQIDDQIVIEFVIYINDFENQYFVNQYFVSFNEYQRYINFFEILHSYLRFVVMKQMIEMIIRTQLKNFFRVIEKIESLSKYFKNFFFEKRDDREKINVNAN